MKNETLANFPAAIKKALAEPEQEQSGFFSREAMKAHSDGHVTQLEQRSANEHLEPVAWMDGYRNIYSLEEKAAGCPEATIPLVPLANQQKTSGSPICQRWAVFCGGCRKEWSVPYQHPGKSICTDCETKLYTHPQPKREPLTDEEANELWESTDSDWELMKRVEAKLKEKNT